MKKVLCILLTIIFAAMTVIPTLVVSATTTDEQIELIEGTYAPDQVVVMFKDSAINTDPKNGKGDLAAVGADFGEMMSAVSDEDKAQLRLMMKWILSLRASAMILCLRIRLCLLPTASRHTAA